MYVLRWAFYKTRKEKSGEMLNTKLVKSKYKNVRHFTGKQRTKKTSMDNHIHRITQ